MARLIARTYAHRSHATVTVTYEAWTSGCAQITVGAGNSGVVVDLQRARAGAPFVASSSGFDALTVDAVAAVADALAFAAQLALDGTTTLRAGLAFTLVRGED